MDRQAQLLIDEALVIEAQAGSSAALDSLVRRWQRRMYAYARRLLGHDDKAWDACQDAWIGIVRGLGRLSDPQLFGPWAYRIVTNKCKDRLSEDARRAWANSEIVAETEEHVPHGSSDSLELKEALGLLPGHMQAVLTLRYLEGFALSEIAGILGAPEGTIKSRLHRARTELKRIWEK